MDKLETALKEDAEAIRAEISPDLEARINASIHAAAPSPKRGRGSRTAFAWWWLSSLSGVAAVFLLIVFLNRGETPSVEGVAEIPVASDPAAPATAPLVDIPLDVRTAEFAEPLAVELHNLKSDLEKAREKIGNDLRFTL